MLPRLLSRTTKYNNHRLSKTLPLTHLLTKTPHRVYTSNNQTRTIFQIKSPINTSPTGVFVTKYQITLPDRPNTDWDDFLIAHPDRDALQTTSKEIPLFLKYLRVVTDKENRKDDFSAFMKTVGTVGLEVENDVYLTTEELLAVMWKNGYSQVERNGLQFTFPSDYRFHVPELAVLFDLKEEDCYHYCMRSRIEKSTIGQLKTDKIKRGGWIRDHWIIFGTSAFIFKTFSFFNYYFVLKGFGIGMWVWTCYCGMARYFGTVIAKNQFNNQQKTGKDLIDGEDRIMQAMQRYANDSRCIDAVKDFNNDISTSMPGYRQSLILKEKNAVIEKAQKQLQAILSFEDACAGKLQEALVKEIASDFRSQFGKDSGMQKKAMDSAIQGLSGSPVKSDPVTDHFLASLKSVDLTGKAKPNKSGTISERISALQAQQEQDFVQQFYIAKDEVSKAKSAKNPDSEYEKLFEKVGYHVPGVGSGSEESSLPSGIGLVSADGYLKKASDTISKLDKQIEMNKKETFKAAFG